MVTRKDSVIEFKVKKLCRITHDFTLGVKWLNKEYAHGSTWYSTIYVCVMFIPLAKRSILVTLKELKRTVLRRLSNSPSDLTTATENHLFI